MSALDRLLAVHSDAVLSTHTQHGDATACVDAARLLAVLEFLRDDDATRFELLVDLCAVDYASREPRFEVVYHLYSVSLNHRLRIKAGVAESSCEIASACSLWPAANWLEREVWDLYGIRFSGHPNLRRLLLDESFEGHPLRKDFPKRGHAARGVSRRGNGP